MPRVGSPASAADDVVAEAASEAGRVEHPPAEGQAGTDERVVVDVMVAHVADFLEALHSETHACIDEKIVMDMDIDGVVLR